MTVDELRRFLEPFRGDVRVALEVFGHSDELCAGGITNGERLNCSFAGRDEALVILSASSTDFWKKRLPEVSLAELGPGTVLTMPDGRRCVVSESHSRDGCVAVRLVDLENGETVLESGR